MMPLGIKTVTWALTPNGSGNCCGGCSATRGSTPPTATASHRGLYLARHGALIARPIGHLAV